MGTIQKSPEGYRDVLGLVGSDQAPLDVSRTLSPTIETTPFYLSRALDIVIATSAAVSINGSSGLVSAVVPAGEAWYVYSVSGEMANINAAAADIEISIAFDTGASRTTVHRILHRPNLNTADVLRIGLPVVPVVLTPGSAIVLQNDAPRTRTADVTVSALVARLNSG